ncbi:cytochrome-b5 reductase NDAI_0E00200 [Naumovozyma dairenensis CBS 421]|uniref:NADH-cytochrome b5 reductase n=1 Tax=Naumovozyma dairenensis (strain ATCC 10597 / BCRC 20456 / CBS 421 / NBRC 0211 / NRRL Y-12639) TaxID=1071378 RepID=G0WAR6_NAUDC|nr:hypothetical protein NDAI_0E00200 [Naumovozyma dairenensis CBS 421]CCD24836.1 hypothetical protein NDAI_0E00200 [Naumovozyma dairenensis CBS 421]
MSAEEYEEEQPNILDDPIHGIYIPTALFVFGIALLTYLSKEYRLLLALPILFTSLVVRALLAYQRRRSLFPDKWTKLELEDQTVISKNTALYRFKLKTPLESLNIPAGFHIAARVFIDGKEEIRYYNPISSKLDKGYFDLLIKSYADGKVSKYFAGLKPGESVEFKGPIGELNYNVNSSTALAIVAGGSGITPVLQMLNEIITTPEDLTKVSLIYANDTENDILLKDELDEMAKKYPHFDIHYVVRYPSETWKGDVGLVTREQMQKYLPESSDDHRLLICGPEGMENMVVNYAKELGWKQSYSKSKGDDQVYVF